MLGSKLIGTNLIVQFAGAPFSIKLGIADASSVSMMPGSVLPTGRPVVYLSTPKPLFVVTKYVIEPIAGLRDGGLVMLVKVISTSYPLGINVGIAYLSLFGSGLPVAKFLDGSFKKPVSSSRRVPGTLYSPL